MSDALRFFAIVSIGTGATHASLDWLNAAPDWRVLPVMVALAFVALVLAEGREE